METLTFSKEPRIGNSKRFFGPIIAHVVAITVIFLGLACALLGYIYSGRLSWNANEIVTTVPQGNILFITGMTSKVAITAVPMVMAIAAFLIADRWLRNSLTFSHASGLPTPYQYSLLLRIFGSANIFSAWSSIQYAVRTPNKRRATLSSPLITSFSILIAVLVIAWGIVIVDFGLHSVSETSLVLQDGGSSTSQQMYGRKLTESCQNRQGINGNGCTVISGGSLGTHIIGFMEAMRIVGGISSNTSVISIPLTTDANQSINIAALVQQNTQTNLAYTAPTVGHYFQCDVLTPRCTINNTCMACFTYDCSQVGWAIPSAWRSQVGGAGTFFADAANVDPTRQNVASGSENNPYPVVAMVGFPQCDASGPSDPNGDCRHDPGWFTALTGESYMFLGCSATVVDLQIRYVNGSFSIDSYSLSGNATTHVVSNPIDSADWVPYLASRVAPLALVGDSESFARGFEKELALILLPMAQYAFESAPTTSQWISGEVLATIIPTSWLIAFFVLILLYIIFTFALAVVALYSSKDALTNPQPASGDGPKVVNVVQLAADRLRHPTGLICEYFEGEGQWKSLERDGVEMFDETRGKTEEGIGIGIKSGGSFGFFRTG